MNSLQTKVAAALTALTEGLRPFVQQQLKATFRDEWLDVARSSFRNERVEEELPEDIHQWDAHALLTVMWDQWNSAFRRKLSLFERSLVAELRAFRNRWAHQRDFNFDDTYRFLDSVQRLLSKIPASNVGMISELKFEVLREEFGDAINEQARELENRRDRWVVSFVYASCGSVFVYLVPTTFQAALGPLAWVIAAAVGTAFTYLIYIRLKKRPAQVGPRECRRCSRIIYGTSCPYCSGTSGPALFDSKEFRLTEDESVNGPKPVMPR